MAKLTDKQKVLVVAGAGILLSGAAGFGIWWAQGLVEEESRQIVALEGQISAAEKQIAKIPGLEEEVIILRENVGEYVKILPADDYINNFVRRTEQFLRRSGVRIRKINPGATGSQGKFDHYTYRIELEGTLWQILKFTNEFENYERFVRVKDFSLSSGDGKKEMAVAGMPGEYSHTVTMQVETYVYRGGVRGKNVVIPNYSTKRDKLRERILANALSIKLRRYEYKDSQGRRDIFIDPRQSSSQQSQANSLDVQKERIEKFVSDVQAVREVFARVQDKNLTYLERAKLERTLREQLQALNVGIADVGERKLITWPPYRLKWNNEVVQPTSAIQLEINKHERAVPDRWLSMEQLEELLASLRRDMGNGDFDAVRERYEAVKSKLGVHAEDERYRVVEDIETVMLYVDAIDEFSDMTLAITGVVVQESGRSGLLVNGQVLEEGEYVSDELVLKRVAPESAEFLYRGFIIVKNW